MEWYQIKQTHGFHVFDAIPLAPFHPLLWNHVGLIYHGCQPISIQGSNHPGYNTSSFVEFLSLLMRLRHSVVLRQGRGGIHKKPIFFKSQIQFYGRTRSINQKERPDLI